MPEMTSKERILAAYEHKPVDRIPCSPRISAWLQDHYGSMDTETHLRSAREFGFDAHLITSVFESPFDLTVREAYDLPDVKYSFEEHEERGYRVVRRLFETPEGTLTDVTRFPPAGDRTYGISPNPVHSEHLFKSGDDLRKIKYLVPDPRRAKFEDYFELERMAGQNALVMFQVHSAVNHRSGDALATEDMMVLFHDDRALFDAYIGLFHEMQLDEVRAAIEAGVRHFFLNWYYNSMSTGWSPVFWTDYFGPQLKEMCDLIRAAGGTANLYDDGNCMKTIDIMADAGIDVLQTLPPPPVGDTDLAEVKRRIGDRVCLMGHVDLLYVIQRGTPELIDETVREVIETAGPTGFILGTSDSIRDGTPLENVHAYFNAARRYGQIE